MGWPNSLSLYTSSFPFTLSPPSLSLAFPSTPPFLFLPLLSFLSPHQSTCPCFKDNYCNSGPSGSVGDLCWRLGTSAEGSTVERCRREDRGAEGAEGVGCAEGVPLPTGGGAWGRGCSPSPEKNVSIFYLKKVTFGAFWVLLLQLY